MLGDPAVAFRAEIRLLTRYESPGPSLSLLPIIAQPHQSLLQPPQLRLCHLQLCHQRRLLLPPLLLHYLQQRLLARAWRHSSSTPRHAPLDVVDLGRTNGDGRDELGKAPQASEDEERGELGVAALRVKQ